jgi:hypothetical protein
MAIPPLALAALAAGYRDPFHCTRTQCRTGESVSRHCCDV